MTQFDASHNCDHIYFKKQIFYWTQYKVDGMNLNCEYSHPIEKEGNNYNQNSQKLARTSILFTDKVSIEDPAAGIKVKYGSGTHEALWQSTNHLREFICMNIYS